MRLLIIGTLGGQLTTATKLAMDKGASVTHAESNEQALAVLRSGRGAESCTGWIYDYAEPPHVRNLRDILGDGSSERLRLLC